MTHFLFEYSYRHLLTISSGRKVDAQPKRCSWLQQLNWTLKNCALLQTWKRKSAPSAPALTFIPVYILSRGCQYSSCAHFQYFVTVFVQSADAIHRDRETFQTMRAFLQIWWKGEHLEIKLPYNFFNCSNVGYLIKQYCSKSIKY